MTMMETFRNAMFDNHINNLKFTVDNDFGKYYDMRTKKPVPEPTYKFTFRSDLSKEALLAIMETADGCHVMMDTLALEPLAAEVIEPFPHICVVVMVPSYQEGGPSIAAFRTKEEAYEYAENVENDVENEDTDPDDAVHVTVIESREFIIPAAEETAEVIEPPAFVKVNVSEESEEDEDEDNTPNSDEDEDYNTCEQCHKSYHWSNIHVHPFGCVQLCDDCGKNHCVGTSMEHECDACSPSDEEL